MNKQASRRLSPQQLAKNSDIIRCIQETHNLTIRAARRCAYDLDHAVAMMQNTSLRNLYNARARYWISLFQSGNTTKDYRDDLHRQLDDKDRYIEGLEKLLTENKIGFEHIKFFGGKDE